MPDDGKWVKLDVQSGVEADGKNLTPVIARRLRIELMKPTYDQEIPHKFTLLMQLAGSRDKERVSVMLTPGVDFKEERGGGHRTFWLTPDAIGKITDAKTQAERKIGGAISSVRNVKLQREPTSWWAKPRPDPGKAR